MVAIECLYCVLLAFERCQGTISEAKGLSQLNVCIVFCTHLSDIMAISTDEGLCQLNVCIVFYMHLSDTRLP
jgi:hypothetical protein